MLCRRRCADNVLHILRPRAGLHIRPFCQVVFCALDMGVSLDISAKWPALPHQSCLLLRSNVPNIVYHVSHASVVSIFSVARQSRCPKTVLGL